MTTQDQTLIDLLRRNWNDWPLDSDTRHAILALCDITAHQDKRLTEMEAEVAKLVKTIKNSSTMRGWA